MTQENTILLQRIKKLLALSHSTNPNEAAMALQRAQKMMRDNAITMNEITLSEIGEQNEEILPALRERTLFSLLSSIIEGAFGVTAILHSQGRKYTHVSFIGPRSRLDSACYTYVFLGRQASIMKKQFVTAERERLRREQRLLIESFFNTICEPRGGYEINLYSKELYIANMLKTAQQEINNQVRRATKAYMRGWLSAIKARVIAFAQDLNEVKRINFYIAHHYKDLVTSRSRASRMTAHEFSSYQQGRNDGRTGFELLHGLKGNSSPALGFNN